jgi:hypothetical protein
MVYVSVSAYQDAALLDGCLQAIREQFPDAPVTVVDGRYETFRPDAPDNSTDHTSVVASAHGARYDPAGPFEREVDKHRYRVAQAPADERALFLDADERLVTADLDALQLDRAYACRIHNPLVYSENPIVYWPRLFRPRDVDNIAKWDAYAFDVPCIRTDHVTIAHRHDLRDREYREAKYERFGREDRRGRYEEAFERYLDNDWPVTPETCPECGDSTLVRSPATMEGAPASAVEVCIRTDSCHHVIDDITIGPHQYLPNDWRRGLDEAPERLRLELLDAGADFLAMHDFSQALTADRLDEYRPLIRLFVEDTFGDGEAQVFGAND